MEFIKRPHFDYLKSMITSATAKNSLWLIASNFFNAFLSVIVIVIVSRQLGPQQFGVVAIFNAIWLTIVTVTDLGLGTSAIKFISKYLVHSPRRANRYMRVIFELELLCGLVIGVFGVLFSSQIAALLGGAHLNQAVRYGFLAGLFVSAGAFLHPFLLSHNRVRTLFAVNASGAGLRIAAIVVLLLADQLTLLNIMRLYTIVPIFLFILAFFVSPKGYLTPITWSERWKTMREIVHFSKWIFLSTIAVVAFGKLDVLILSSLRGSTEVGLYTAAIQLTSFSPLLMGALSNAALPKVASLSGQPGFGSYIRKAVFAFSFIAISLIPLFFLSEPLINLIFGDKFDNSVKVFQIIYPGFLFLIATAPLQLLFYAIDKPKILTFINFLQVIILVGLDLLLIPSIGLYGAAWGYLASTAIGVLLVVIVGRHFLKQQPE